MYDALILLSKERVSLKEPGGRPTSQGCDPHAPGVGVRVDNRQHWHGPHELNNADKVSYCRPLPLPFIQFDCCFSNNACLRSSLHYSTKHGTFQPPRAFPPWVLLPPRTSLQPTLRMNTKENQNELRARTVIRSRRLKCTSRKDDPLSVPVFSSHQSEQPAKRSVPVVET